MDPGSGDPKGFLLAEYDGHCQICATELRMSSGEKWIDVLHIEELREGSWWGNRPFNILGLCPNCHALAKHGGGRDFTNIYVAAKAASNGLEIPVEVEEYHGDYYAVPVSIAGVNRRLVMSKVHLNYFSALLAGGKEAEMFEAEVSAAGEINLEKSKTLDGLFPKSELSKFLLDRGLRKSDLQIQGGTLWVMGGSELTQVMWDLRDKGYPFTYTRNGSKATNNKPGWFCKMTAGHLD